MSLAELSPAQKEEMVISLSALLLQDSGVDMSAENLDAVIKVIFFNVSDQGCGSVWYNQHVSTVCIARERLRFLSLRGARDAPPSLSDGAVSRPTYAYNLPDSVYTLSIRERAGGSSILSTTPSHSMPVLSRQASGNTVAAYYPALYASLIEKAGGKLDKFMGAPGAGGGGGGGAGAPAAAAAEGAAPEAKKEKKEEEEEADLGAGNMFGGDG